MPKIKIVGGQTIHVSDRIAENIRRWKEDEKMPKDKMVDIDGKNYLELSQIKGVIEGVEDVELQIQKERQQSFAEKIKDWEDYVLMVKSQNPEEKSKRMIKSGCYLLNIARGNGQEIKKELSDKLMFELLPFFEEERERWWAGKEIYQKHIPKKEIDWGTRDGIKSLGQLMYESK